MRIIRCSIVAMIASAVVVAVLFYGCSKQQVIYSKPSMQFNSGWRWYEACGYQCKPMVDYFEGEGISIRVESFNYEEIFTIYLVFVAKHAENVTINPEAIRVKLADGRIIPSKSKRAGYTKEEYKMLEDLDRNYIAYRRAAPPVVSDLSLDTPWWPDKHAIAISSFFDVSPPPHPSEEFELHINGLKKNGQKVDVPVIKFGPAVRDSGHGIPIDG